MLVVAGAAGAVALVGVAIVLVVGLTGASGHLLPGLPAATAQAHGPGSAGTTPTSTPAGHARDTGGQSRPAAEPGAPPTTSPPATSPTASPIAKPGQGSVHRRVPTQTPSHGKNK